MCQGELVDPPKDVDSDEVDVIEEESENSKSGDEEEEKQEDIKPKANIITSEFEEIENKRGNFLELLTYVQALCKRLKEKYTQFNMNGT